ncbi:disintegrin and metalloproteinase domain-containing protein 10 homolog [Dermacentor variabilis]|uniref:disintegrin and metalloproteinase domain-containing protein 10 homolog n=1 Tax=Dermacentor variabilis TaxID=34621 RepID=UPI003F5B3E34
MVGLGSFWIALATLSCMASIVYSARTLNDFVLLYEPLAYEPISVGSRRWKRSAAQRQAPRSVEFAFRSYNRSHNLRYYPGAPDSRVVGSIISGVFSGCISLPREGEVFYVERAGHFTQDSAPFHSLIYSARDVSFAGGRCGLHGATKDVMDRIRRQYRRHQSQINDSSVCEGPAIQTNPFCQDSLDAPHALHELSKINHDGFCASFLWTHRDFPGGTLGLAYMAEPDGFSGGICEQFQSGGGIVVGTGTTGYIGRLSLNTGVVTFLNKNMRVPQKVSEITFAHELGHNFGAPHDMPPDCVPDGTGGNFIMFASATRGNKPNNLRFSVCSVRNISAVLMQMFSQLGSRPNCLQEPQGPFCGNSIREMNEECDCGYERQDCGADVCCYAREHGEINRKPCTLRPGAACSPSNGACCSTDCRFHNTSTACRPEDDCTFEAYCTGTSGECPSSDWKPDGTLCNHATQLCDAGECSQSVCRLYNLVDSYLTGSYLSMEDMCLIACRENVPGSECKEACSFERMRDFCGRRMQPGAPCYDLQGYCDVFQKCHLIDAQGLLSRLKRLVFGGEGMGSALVRYWYLTLVAVVLAGVATAVFVRVCAVHTPSTNPHLPPERTIMSSARHPVAFIKDVTRFS